MFVKAEYYREKKTVHYFDEDGTETLYVGGNFAWRCNNPGNITKPGKRVIATSIGLAQRIGSNPKGLFLIFPDAVTGRSELKKLLTSVYGESSIADTMNKYAPPSENKTEEYIGYILKKTGASRDDLVGSMSDSDLNSFMDVISRFEGFGVSGEIIPLGKPVAVKLSDKLSKPLQNSSIAIKSGDKNVLAKTDKSGNLPVIYSGLFGREITLYYSRAKDELEKITKLMTNSVSSAYTLKAPYFLISSRPQIHKTDGNYRALVHIVRSGETLSSIAKKYGITAGALVKENGLADQNRIYARQHLRVPTDKTPDPIVKPGTPAAHRGTVVAQAAQTREKQPARAADVRDLAVVQQRSSNGHPVTVLSSPTLELSGSAWCARFKGSSSIDSLNSSYKAKVKCSRKFDLKL